MCNTLAKDSKYSSETYYFDCIFLSTLLSQVVERLYEQLLLIGETFRDLYSWPLMIWISNLCLHSVSNLYFLFDWIIDSASGEDSIQVATTLCILIWIVVYLSQIVLLQYSCEFTAHQVRPVIIRYIFIYYTSNINAIHQQITIIITYNSQFQQAQFFKINF